MASKSIKEQGGQQPQDWHKADILAAVHKAGWSLAELSRYHGYSNSRSISVALTRRWPKAQKLIAEVIGVPPETIWPSRYVEQDTAKHRALPPKTVVRVYKRNKQPSRVPHADQDRRAA